MTSIKDVAKHAGVAISTVSKVLNGYPGVSEATRAKVQAAIQELNFVPNSIAAALSSKKAGRIALLINQTSESGAIDEIDMHYLIGAIEMSQQLHLEPVTYFSSMLEGKSPEEIILYFKAQSVEGIIIYGMTKKDKTLMQVVKSGEFKTVLVDVPYADKDTSGIGVDQKQAQKEVALRTMEDNQCKSILYLAGDKNSYAGCERLEAIEELAKEKGYKLMVRYGDFSELKARELTFQYAKKKDAVICGSDIMAIGAMRALIEMDIFRPVCGFGGLTLMGYAGKQMNTIQQHFSKVSAQAVEELQYLLNDGEGRIVVTPHSMERMKYLDVIC